MLPLTEYIYIICMTYKRSNFPYIKVLCVVDLRPVNEHLWKQSVKFEDMRTARQHIKLKSSMLAFDINLAYHHVDIYEPHTEFSKEY
jgi:hypothetical protein